MNELIVANMKVRQDEQGRYCLNDLHRAAGGASKDQPGKWLVNKQTTEMIDELEITGIPVIESKQGLGTFVCKELVYHYAMWISAEFSLKVIRAYDSKVAPQVQLTRLELARQVVEGLEREEALQIAYDQQTARIEEKEIEIKTMRPKVVALQKLTEVADNVTLSDTAKLLTIKRDHFTSALSEFKWIFKRSRKYNAPWVASQFAMQKGWLVEKLNKYTDFGSGEVKVAPQVMVTPLGVSVLAATKIMQQLSYVKEAA